MSVTDQAKHEQLELEHGKVIHACPLAEHNGLMPCCGKTPFEVPGWHRMTLEPELVTCGR